MDLSIQFFVLRAEYFYFCHIYSTVKREAVGGIIILADIRSDTCTFAYPARISGSDWRVAGSAGSRAAYNGCICCFSSGVDQKNGVEMFAYERKSHGFCILLLYLLHSNSIFLKSKHCFLAAYFSSEIHFCWEIHR